MLRLETVAQFYNARDKEKIWTNNSNALQEQYRQDAF